MKNQTYNGWANYATWRVNLEVFDGLNLRNHFDTIPDAYTVGKWAEEYAEELIDAALSNPSRVHGSMLTPSDIVSGWVRAFLDDVDWYSIAEHLIEDASEVDA